MILRLVVDFHACHSGAARSVEPGVQFAADEIFGFRVRDYIASRNDGGKPALT